LNKNVTQDEFLRKRVARQRKIRKRRLKIFFTLFVIFLLGLSVILCLTVFFPIENLTAKGSALYKSEEIIKASDIKLGDNLFAITEGNTLKKIKHKLPYIESVEFKRTLPDSLMITVKDADEYACYYDGKAYYTVSKSGWVLKKEYEPPDNIFTVKGAKVECKVGASIIFSKI
jgi:cell division septal protein FtsQ